MSAPPSERSSLARLVLFMVCLAAAASIVAGAHFIAIDLPQQKNLQAPTNSCTWYSGNTCEWLCAKQYCHYTEFDSESGVGGNRVCPAAYDTCVATLECHEISPPCNSCNVCTDRCDDYYNYFCQKKPGYTEGDCAGIRDTCYSACPC